jgi:hypothetical protein
MDQTYNQADRQGDWPDRQPVAGEACWVTFADLAKFRGISKASAIALVWSQGWRRQRDNLGHVIVLVPSDWLTHGADSPRDDAPDSRPDQHIGDEASWLTFADLAKSRGISKASAIALVWHHDWHCQRNDQGQFIALVPSEWLMREADSPRDGAPDSLAVMAPAADATGAAIEAQYATFRQALAAVEAAHAMAFAAMRADQERTLALLQSAHEAQVEKLNLTNAALIEAVTTRAAMVEASLATVTAERDAARADLATERRHRAAAEERATNAGSVAAAAEQAFTTLQREADDIKALVDQSARQTEALRETHAVALTARDREIEAIHHAHAAKLTTVLSDLDSARSNLAAERDHSRTANQAVVAERERHAGTEARASKAEADIAALREAEAALRREAEGIKALVDQGAREIEVIQASHTAEVEALNLANAALIEARNRSLAAVTARATTAEDALEQVREDEARRAARPLLPRIILAALRR